MNDCGLVWDKTRHCYVWGWHHGWGRQLMQNRVARWLVDVYVDIVNAVACRIWEHDWLFDMDKIPEALPYVGDGHDEAYVTAFWEKYRDEVCTSCGAHRTRSSSPG